ncbi:PLP-dependent transferase [Shigella flexneri]
MSPRDGGGSAQARGDCGLPENPAAGEEAISPVAAGKPGHQDRCARQQKGFGAMLSFELDGDEQTLRSLPERVVIVYAAESLGGVEARSPTPLTMTHAGMAPEARAAAGISETLLRILYRY